MKKFIKTTNGFVNQVFEQNENGEFVCIGQEFITGDECEYEEVAFCNKYLAPEDVPEYQYQSFDMVDPKQE